VAERGRQPGFRMSEEHRVKIQNSNILNALIEHVEGKRDMSATQVSAGIGLLRKVMPDLAASTVDQTTTHEVGNSVADLMKAIDGRTRSK
jgi:hypothetical protein